MQPKPKVKSGKKERLNGKNEYFQKYQYTVQRNLWSQSPRKGHLVWIKRQLLSMGQLTVTYTLHCILCRQVLLLLLLLLLWPLFQHNLHQPVPER